jgi:hypothetical protein
MKDQPRTPIVSDDFLDAAGRRHPKTHSPGPFVDYTGRVYVEGRPDNGWRTYVPAYAVARRVVHRSLIILTSILAVVAVLVIR